MFFILMHSIFLGILLPDHVSYTNTKVTKQIPTKRTRYYKHYLLKKQRSAIVKSEKRKWQATRTKICASTANNLITGKMNAEPGFKTTNLARTARAENTGRNNTLMRKRLTEDQLHQSRHSRIMSHH